MRGMLVTTKQGEPFTLNGAGYAQKDRPIMIRHNKTETN